VTSIVYLVSILFPWFIRRRILTAFLGYRLHPTSRIGLAWVTPKILIMDSGASIQSFTICKSVDLLHLQRNSAIGKGNWITGFPTRDNRHFAHQMDRRSELVLGQEATITSRHIIDCTSAVTIGAYSIFAGSRSQILTHSIDLAESRQSSAPITIGEYAFVGTDCVFLGGSALPDRSVLGAKSLLNKKYDEPHWLYAGIPAKPVKKLSPEMKYFGRAAGFVP
jgi:acetyltransferase-like isoleucine patch superfamily enzyme